MSGQSTRPILFVISGPSGSGKGTALKSLMQLGALSRVATYTTRTPRAGEQEGTDYRFVSSEDFARLAESGEIWEVSQTYGSHHYGSPRAILDLEPESPSIIELEPNGFLRVRAMSARRVVGIFVLPPSRSQLVQRLEARGPGQDYTERLRVADEQVSYAWSYDYCLINDDLATFTEELHHIVHAEMWRTRGAYALTNYSIS